MPADAWRGDELQEEKVEFIVDSGCTHPTCTAATANKLTNLRPGEYLGAFQTPDGSQSTPKRAGDLVGTIGSTTTMPLVVSDIAVQQTIGTACLPISLRRFGAGRHSLLLCGHRRLSICF